MADIPVYVSFKFEMYIFKIALVISENVRIAFLYVLSISLREFFPDAQEQLTEEDPIKNEGAREQT